MKGYIRNKKWVVTGVSWDNCDALWYKRENKDMWASFASSGSLSGPFVVAKLENWPGIVLETLSTKQATDLFGAPPKPQKSESYAEPAPKKPQPGEPAQPEYPKEKWEEHIAAAKNWNKRGENDKCCFNLDRPMKACQNMKLPDEFAQPRATCGCTQKTEKPREDCHF